MDIFKKIIITSFYKIMLTWWGNTFLTFATGFLGIFLASFTPVLSLYAPFSYFLCFILTLLIVFTLLYVIKETILSGAKKRTFVELEFKNNNLHTTKNRGNIHHIGIHKGESGLYKLLVIFKNQVHTPTFEISDTAGLEPEIINATPYNKHCIFEVSNCNSKGRFTADFNEIPWSKS